MGDGGDDSVMMVLLNSMIKTSSSTDLSISAILIAVRYDGVNDAGSKLVKIVVRKVKELSKVQKTSKS